MGKMVAVANYTPSYICVCGVDIYLHSFFSSELDRGERSTSPSACFRCLLTDIPGPLCSLHVVCKKRFPAAVVTAWLFYFFSSSPYAIHSSGWAIQNLHTVPLFYL